MPTRHSPCGGNLIGSGCADEGCYGCNTSDCTPNNLCGTTCGCSGCDCNCPCAGGAQPQHGGDPLPHECYCG